MKIKYFDNAATTKISDEVFKEMIPYLLEEYGNSSSLYSIGRRAKRAIETARVKVAKLINCLPEEVYFTSCGSESDNTAIKGIANLLKNKGNHIVTSKIEHPAILNSCKSLENKGFEVTYVGVDEYGRIDIEELEKSINNKTILISIMAANNEVGTIEPIERISQIAHKNNIIFHTDAVQAIGNMQIDVKKMEIDMLSMSGHKIHAPKGVGALYVKKDIKFEKFLDGGHQERNMRAGTENVASIVAFGKACEIANNNLEKHVDYLLSLRDYYISQVKSKIKDIKINGDMKKRLPGNANISFKFVDGNALLFMLDEKGICASTGSACSSGSLEPSHVLFAMGMDSNIANGTLRVSFSNNNTKEDVDYLIECLVEAVEKLRSKK